MKFLIGGIIILVIIVAVMTIKRNKAKELAANSKPMDFYGMASTDDKVKAAIAAKVLIPPPPSGVWFVDKPDKKQMAFNPNTWSATNPLIA